MASGGTCNCVSDWLTLSQQLELQDLAKLFEYFTNLQSEKWRQRRGQCLRTLLTEKIVDKDKSGPCADW